MEMNMLTSAFAYIGPGLSGGIVATVLGVLGSIFLAIFAIVWYPVKRMIKRLSGKSSVDVQADGVSAENP